LAFEALLKKDRYQFLDNSQIEEWLFTKASKKFGWKFIAPILCFKGLRRAFNKDTIETMDQVSREAIETKAKAYLREEKFGPFFRETFGEVIELATQVDRTIIDEVFILGIW